MPDTYVIIGSLFIQYHVKLSIEKKTPRIFGTEDKSRI